MYGLLGKVGKVLFHRVAVMGALIVLQIALYVAGVLWLEDSAYYAVFSGASMTLSVLATMWIVASDSNPGYKIGWVSLVLVLQPLGSLAYLLLGGNRMSAFNQRRLRTMARRIAQNLGEDCDRTPDLMRDQGEDAGRLAHYIQQSARCPVYRNTSTRFYPLGDLCYQDILDDLRQAKRYIFIAYFIIEEGKLWNSVRDILKEKMGILCLKRRY